MSNSRTCGHDSAKVAKVRARPKTDAPVLRKEGIILKKMLPWDSLPPPIYTARANKPRKKWVKIGGWVLVAALLLFGVSSINRNLPLALISMIFSILYSITMVTVKDAAITCRGLEIFYNMQITTHYDFFAWEGINSIVIEDRGDEKYVRLHIGYGNLEKALLFKRSEVSAICGYAKEQNPDIRVLKHEAGSGKLNTKRKK